MEVRFDDRDQFPKLAARFRAAGKGGAAVRKALTATIQAELKTVVEDVKANVRTMPIRGTGGRGSVRRGQFDAAQEARRIARAAAKGRATRSRRSTVGTGLRERIAHGVKSRVQYTGFKLGAKVLVDASALPQSQRKLPRYLNTRSGWRHPVWGHRDRWVAQFGDPYFDRAVQKHRDRVRRKVKAAVDEVMRMLK